MKFIFCPDSNHHANKVYYTYSNLDDFSSKSDQCEWIHVYIGKPDRCPRTPWFCYSPAFFPSPHLKISAASGWPSTLQVGATVKAVFSGFADQASKVVNVNHLVNILKLQWKYKSDVQYNQNMDHGVTYRTWVWICNAAAGNNRKKKKKKCCVKISTNQ